MNATALEIEATVPDPNYRAQIIGFPRPDPDFQLVARTAAGDDSAFKYIVLKFRPYLHSVAYNLLRCHQDAEEIADDALIRALRGATAFRGDSTVKTWLTTITVNLARNRYWYYHRRKQEHHRSVDAPISEDGSVLADILPDDGADVRRAIHIEELKGRILDAFDRLSEKHAEILALSFVDGLNYEEIAVRLGIGLGTVKSRLARARQAIRANMAPE